MKSKSDVQLDGYSSNSRFPAGKPRTPLNGFMMTSQQVIIEKLKLENELLNTTYKTTAYVTFSNGTVFKGVIELNSETLSVKEDFGTPIKIVASRDSLLSGSDFSFKDASAAAGPFDDEIHDDTEFTFETSRIESFVVLRNTFVLTIR